MRVKRRLFDLLDWVADHWHLFALLMLVCVIVDALDLRFTITVHVGQQSEPSSESHQVSDGRTETTVHPNRRNFYVNGTVRGKTVKFLVDTGSHDVAFSYEMGEQLGFEWKDGVARCYQTANGKSCGVVYILEEIRVGDIAMQNVEVSVLPKGTYAGNLLGMSFLRRLSRFEYRQDSNVLVLVK